MHVICRCGCCGNIIVPDWEEHVKLTTHRKAVIGDLIEKYDAETDEGMKRILGEMIMDELTGKEN